MKYLIIILFGPVLLFTNLIGGLSALLIIGAVNGYLTVIQLLEKAREK